MKKKLLILPIVAALLATGCGPTGNKSNLDTSLEPVSSESISAPSSSEEPASSKTSRSVPAPIVLGGDFEEACKKDYKNMTVSFALNSTMFGQEWGYEYYLGGSDFVAVMDGTTAETYGIDYAWSFYSYYNNKSYAYWDFSYYVTEGWISNGSKGIAVGIDYAYFYMPYFLKNISKDDVDYVLGTYVVKETSVDKVLEGLKFTWMGNDITYIDMKVNENGYISRIRGFDDPNNEEYGFQIEMSNYGVTKAPDGVDLPPAISASNIKTYADMLGHEEEPDIYLTNINIVINDTVESDSAYDIIAYPDDVVDVSFTYLPTNANKKEVNWVSSDEDVVEILYSPESGHRYLRAVKEGEVEIYVTHVNEAKQIVKSNVIKMKVNAPKPVPTSDQDVYRFLFTGSNGSNGNNAIGASNTLLGSQAPYDIKAWRMEVRSGANSDNFAEDDMVLYSACNSQNNFTTRFEDEVIFDFENQQVSQMSFAYALYRNNALSNLSRLESVVISTSNEGEAWTDIDVTSEVKTELNKASASTGMSPKVLTKTFAPASLVKIVIKASQVGGYEIGIGMKDFVFSKNSECHNYNDVDPNPVTSIVISAPKSKLKIGNSMKFTAVVNPDNATNKNVRWVSSNPDIISIDSRTGLATANAEGRATIKAVSTTNREMVSNEIEIETYIQETIFDPNNFLTGKTFLATGVNNGTNTFDVSFAVKSSTTALMTLTMDMGAMGPFVNNINLTFDNFDPLTDLYEFNTTDNGVVIIKVATDGNSIELTYKNSTGGYVIGNAASGVTLEKVR